MTKEKDQAFYSKLWGLMNPNPAAEPYAGDGGCSRCLYAWRTGSELYAQQSLSQRRYSLYKICFLRRQRPALGYSEHSIGEKAIFTTLDDIFCMALRLCGLVSVIFFCACMFIPDKLMLIFTNETVLIGHGVDYLRIAGFSYLLTGISQCYLVIMKTSEHARTTAIISSATVCINIVLNAVLIFGGFGIPAMNVRGAAIATLISRIIELTVSVIVSYRPGYIHPYIGRLFKRNKQLAQDFRKCALPLLGACLFWGIGFTSYSSFMGHLGTDAAAANSVAAVVRDIICCFSAGISSAAGIMIGNELGAGNLERGKAYGIRMLKISMACGAAMSLLMGISAPVILHFVKPTPQAAYLPERNVWCNCLLYDRTFY